MPKKKRKRAGVVAKEESSSSSSSEEVSNEEESEKSDESGDEERSEFSSDHIYTMNEFWYAIADGNLSAVESCLEQGMDIHKKRTSRSGEGLISPIMLAASYGHEKIVELLEQELEKKLGESSEEESEEPQTKSNSSGFWGGLIPWGKKAKADTVYPVKKKVSKEDEYVAFFENEGGYTFLHAAVAGQKLALVKKAIEVYCISPNASFNVPNTNAWKTPIVAAAIGKGKESKQIANYLLRKGAKIEPSALNEEEPEDKVFLHPFVEAAKQNNIAMMRYFLERGVSVNSRDGYGQTAISVAVHNQDKAAAEFLVERDASFNTSNDRNLSPLMEAAKNNDLAEAEFLVNHGVYVNFRCKGKTALDYACEENVKFHFEKSVANLLINNGANVNLLTEKEWFRCIEDVFLYGGKDIFLSWVPFFFSEKLDHLSSICCPNVLANCVVDEERATSFNEICDEQRLFRAARKGDMEELKLLLSPRERQVYADTARIDEDGNTPLHIACYHGQAQAARYLLSKQADANAKNKKNETPLMRAVDSPYKTIEIVRLLYAVTDLETQDDKGRTALMMATLHPDEMASFDLLLTKPQNLELRGSDNYTAFLMAVAAPNLQAVEALIKHDADILVCWEDNYNALHIVGWRGDEKDVYLIARKLIQNGLPVDSLTSYETTAFNHAITNDDDNAKNIDLCLTLLAPRLLFLIASQKNPTTDAKTWDELFNLGGSLFQRDSHLRTLHHVAASSGNEVFFKYLNNKFKKEADKITKTAVDDEDNTVEKIIEDGGYHDCSYDFSDVDEHKDAFLELATATGKLAQAKRLLNIYNPELYPVREQAQQPHRAKPAAKSKEKPSGSPKVSLASSPFFEGNIRGKRKNIHEDSEDENANVEKKSAGKKSGKSSTAPALRR